MHFIKMNKLRFIKVVTAFLMIFTFYVNRATAQNKTRKAEQLWIDYYPTFILSDRLRISTDGGFRIMFEDKQWERFYIRPTVRYKLNPTWELEGALGLFYFIYDQRIDRLEITPWQGIRLNWPNINALRFSNTVRLEERSSFLIDDDWSSNFDLRIRYRLAPRYSFKPNNKGGVWSVPAYIELFIPANDLSNEFFHNRNREAIGVGYNPSNKWNYNLMFLRQKSRSGPEEDFGIASYILQLQIRTTWNRKD